MQRYAYRYGECSHLAPDNSGGRSFRKGSDQVYYCDDALITFPDRVLCVYYLSCIFIFGRVVT